MPPRLSKRPYCMPKYIAQGHEDHQPAPIGPHQTRASLKAQSARHPDPPAGLVRELPPGSGDAQGIGDVRFRRSQRQFRASERITIEKINPRSAHINCRLIQHVEAHLVHGYHGREFRPRFQSGDICCLFLSSSPAQPHRIHEVRAARRSIVTL